jgi:hypothetical protein
LKIEVLISTKIGTISESRGGSGGKSDSGETHHFDTADRTPTIDIKPCISGIDLISDARDTRMGEEIGPRYAC